MPVTNEIPAGYRYERKGGEIYVGSNNGGATMTVSERNDHVSVKFERHSKSFQFYLQNGAEGVQVVGDIIMRLQPQDLIHLVHTPVQVQDEQLIAKNIQSYHRENEQIFTFTVIMDGNLMVWNDVPKMVLYFALGFGLLLAFLHQQ